MVLEKTLESPLNCKEIQPVNPKGNQSLIFTGRTDAEAETPNLGHLMRRTNSLEKNLMLEKTKGGRRRGREDEMVGWHHRSKRRKFKQTPGAGEGQGSLECCSPWGHKKSDTTDPLNND